MLVKEIMSTPAISVGPDEAIELVARIMTEKRIHGVPVIENEKLIGIITETDFFVKDLLLYLPSYIDFLKKTELKKSLEEDKSGKIEKIINSKAKDIMSSPCTSVSPEDSLNEVTQIFKKTLFATLPVTNENGNLVGIITVSDIIQLIR